MKQNLKEAQKEAINEFKIKIHKETKASMKEMIVSNQASFMKEIKH